MEYKLYLLLNCFNRFVNYLEKNNSKFLFKIEDHKIRFCNTNDHIYHTWYLFTVGSLKTQIEYFFFGNGIVNQCSVFLAFEGMELLKPFGKPSCLEELIMTMDLLEV